MNRSLLVALSLTSLAAFGCENARGTDERAPANTAPANTTQVAPNNAPTSTTNTTEPKREHADHSRDHAGFVGMMFHAARDLDLKSDQKAKVDDADKKLGANDKAIDDERAAFRAELVTEVKAGKIDKAKMESEITTLAKTEDGAKEDDIEALNELHAALDPAQRKTLVEKVREKMNKREEKFDEKSAASAKEDWQKKRLDAITNDLGLDATQQKTVQGFLAKESSQTDMQAKRDEMKKRMDAMLTSFESDTFDAKKLGAGHEKAHDWLNREVNFYEEVLPILRPDQRDKLANEVEKQGDHALMGGFYGSEGMLHGTTPTEGTPLQ